jgi:tRNA nucleotidyltransferase/poly(A) polymerase
LISFEGNNEMMSISTIASVAQIKIPEQTLEQNENSPEFNSEIASKSSDKILADAISKLINLDDIVDRLQGLDSQHCAPFTPEQVKFAFLKWLENHLESIEMQPEWFIYQDSKHFDRHLPELDGYYFPEEEREYDQDVLNEEQAAQHAAEFETIAKLAAAELAAELNATEPSQLEDEFDATPREEATMALDW